MPVWGNVNPSTRIELYTGVPFDRNYTNVVRFTNEADQKGYFYNHLTGYYTGSFAPAYNSNTLNGRTGTILYNSYLNPDGSWIRERPRYTVKVNAVAEQLYKCNYMGWTNNPAQQELNPQNFDEDNTCPEQWYYAFITNIYHEANNVSVIEFELDYWQTYHLRITPLQCWVERESPESDEPFEHLEPESINPTLYEQTTNCPLNFSMYSKSYVILVSVQTNADIISSTFSGYSVATLQSGLYSGFLYKIYTSNQYNDVRDELDRIREAGQIESVIGVITTYFPPQFSQDEYNKGFNVTTTVNKNITALNGYEFKNKKLMNYPYRKIFLTAGFQTDSVEIKPELIMNNVLELHAYNIYNFVGGVVVCLRNYDGVVLDYKNKIEYNEQYNGALSNDGFSQYINNSMSGDILKSVGNIVAGAVGGFLVGNVAGAAVGAVTGGLASAADIGSNALKAASTPDKSTMPSQNLPLTLISGEPVIVIYDLQAHKQQAKIIDEYFHAFGYNCSKTKVPNLTHGHWSYIKTSNFMCNSDGVSGNGLSAITDMFNNGVRIWNYRGTNGKDFDKNYFCKYSDAKGNLIDRQPEVVYN